jgi:tripeptide aminopeptidase
MTLIERWAVQPQVQAALAHFDDSEAVVETTIAVQQIPAPTFAEAARAAYVRDRMRAIGLQDVHIDGVGNVYGRRAGSGGPALLIAAHTDTVFPDDTDLTVRREPGRVHGPGIGDNSLGVAALLHLADVMQSYDLPNEGDVWFVANVGEEGLGDLRGMRAAVDCLQDQIASAIALEGCDHGRIFYQAIGVRRYRISAAAPGGHSWGDFGSPSAIHALVRLAARISELDVPADPRTTYNIGTIAGGNSVNSIAQWANMLLDMRSVDLQALSDLVAEVDRLIAESIDSERDVKISVEVVGDRPAGRIPHDHPLVGMATAAYEWVNATIIYDVGSTDANIPLSRGIPAVCVGIGNGEHAHRLDEYIETHNIANGMRALLLLTMAATTKQD